MSGSSPFSPYRPLALFSRREDDPEDDPGTLRPKEREETIKSTTAVAMTTKKSSRKRVTFRPILEDQIKEKVFVPAVVARENRLSSSTDTIVPEVQPVTPLDTVGEMITTTSGKTPKPVAEEDVSPLADLFVDDVTKYRRMHNMSDEVMALNIWL